MKPQSYADQYDTESHDGDQVESEFTDELVSSQHQSGSEDKPKAEVKDEKKEKLA